MTRTERLDPVVTHTDKKERQALQAVAASQRELDIELTKISQLKSYKAEYLNQHSTKNSIYSAIGLQEFNRFIDQLDQTIKQQSEIVEMRTQALNSKRNIWQATLINSKVMHKVVENLHKAELRQEDKIEQKVMDELSQRKSLK